MIHSDGMLHTYYLEYSPEDTSIRLTLHLCPSSSSILPSPVCYSCIHMMKDMDCILTYQTMKEEKENRLLILSSTLQLRGIVPISHIIDYFITRYGVFVLQQMETTSRLVKYDFCGVEISTCEIQHTW